MKKLVLGIGTLRQQVAIDLVRGYIEDHLDKSDLPPEFDVYVVWFSKTLQHQKALVSSSLHDGMYYEVTFNGDTNEAYLDAYKKFEHVCIKDIVIDHQG